jgi:hypothetical protein
MKHERSIERQWRRIGAKRTRRWGVVLVALWIALFAFPGAAVAIPGSTVNFEDDLQVGSNITCNPDYPGLTLECAPLHHAWLLSHGIDITGSPNGFVFTTQPCGISCTGVVVGFVSPDYSDANLGLSDGKAMTLHFLNTAVNAVSVDLTVIPSNSPLINNVPATVTMQALDSNGNVIATETTIFTGVTNGVDTPTSMSVTGSGIATVVLTSPEGPYGGVLLEGVTADQPLITPGIETSLVRDLNAVVRALSSGNVGFACTQLSAFVGEVKSVSGIQLNSDLAARLIALANAAGTTIGCG